MKASRQRVAARKTLSLRQPPLPGAGDAFNQPSLDGVDLAELFLAELKTRRKRLKGWLRLLDQEAVRQTKRTGCTDRLDP